MHNTVENLLKINKNVKAKFESNKQVLKIPEIIAVSKTFKIEHIMPVINHGHYHYGENKVQEAVEKWTKIKNENKKIKLHLIGKLQTNKVKAAIKLFDYIHSLDSKKLANKIFTIQNELKIKTKQFIQVNIGNERQKSGISIDEVSSFYTYCKNLNLDIVGLMCIPPFNENSKKYFEIMKNINKELKLDELSMGMSSDYLDAIEYNATFVRIGSSIFGQRG
ncbi:YggS family pyridoxal phosphate-dependent enzyme [Candidatus Pelagibacter sp.]|nr:YggS family pyridoxal phosphate-dependent enzyme [Candidatus Pelagibacter sp.]